MQFLIFHHEDPIARIQSNWEAYKNHLDLIQEKLPLKTRDFVLTDWYYNTHDPRCPHDAWVEHASLKEDATGDRRQIRKINLEVRLLGAWHDGHIDFIYRDVKAYSLKRPENVWLPPDNTGHGDWLYDEVRLSADNRIVHEIAFANKAEWLIECLEIEYKWIPFEKAHP
jgi:hypothetical protein